MEESVEVWHFAQDGPVNWPLELATDNGEIREVAGLEESVWMYQHRRQAVEPGFRKMPRSPQSNGFGHTTHLKSESSW